MKLPSYEQAEVPRPKLVDYLLSTTHRDGRHKAAFFNAFGFFADDWFIDKGGIVPRFVTAYPV